MGSLVSRRRIIQAALAAGGMISIASLRPAPARAAAAAPKVDEKDSMSVALGYVSDAKHVDAKANPQYKAGATCSSCSWYQGKPGDAAGGPCTFFPGKVVDAGGWCKMYNKKT